MAAEILVSTMGNLVVALQLDEASGRLAPNCELERPSPVCGLLA